MDMTNEQVQTHAAEPARGPLPPWRGIGADVAGAGSPQEAMARAGLGWTVSKRRVFIPSEAAQPQFPTGVVGSFTPVDDYFMLVRDDTGEVLGPAGKEYVVTQNSQAFDFYQKFAEAGNMRIRTAGSFKGGRHPWALAELDARFSLPGDDVLKPYILLSCPHIWGKALVLKFTTICPVCYNTLVAALNEAALRYRMTHIREFDSQVRDDAHRTFEAALRQFQGTAEKSQEMAEARIDDQVALRYIADVLQPELIKEAFGGDFYSKAPTRQAAELVNSSTEVDPLRFRRSAYDAHALLKTQPGARLESRDGTVWGAFNAVTYWTDHVAGRDRGNALYSAWFGENANLKSRAFERAELLAQAV